MYSDRAAPYSLRSRQRPPRAPPRARLSDASNSPVLMHATTLPRRVGYSAYLLHPESLGFLPACRRGLAKSQAISLLSRTPMHLYVLRSSTSRFRAQRHCKVLATFVRLSYEHPPARTFLVRT